MIARIVWLSYIFCALAVLPSAFHWRFRRWPILSSFPPRDSYAFANLLFATAQAVYTGSLFIGPAPRPSDTTMGLGLWVGGGGLALWAVTSLGPNWRIGQDRTDETVWYVSRGPYRYIRHPIYAGIVITFIGQGFLTGFDARAWLLIAVAVVYAIVQGRAESRYWGARRALSGDKRRS